MCKIGYRMLCGPLEKKRAVTARADEDGSRIAGALADGSQSVCSLNDVLEFLCPRLWTRDQLLSWPPDVFAMAASILHRSGAYTCVVKSWPPRDPKAIPGGPKTSREWNPWIKEVGRQWRGATVAGRRAPSEVKEWWNCLAHYRNTRVSEVCKHQKLWQALLQLCAAADEACEGVGIPSGDGSQGNPFEVEANLLLVYRKGGSLCRNVDPSRARVLPKLHTPRNGLTIRSLSHNLALCPIGEIEPKWYRLPKYQGHCLNLLLLPWPGVVTPAQFKAAQPQGGPLLNMPERRGFFTYVPRSSSRGVLKEVTSLFQKATKIVGHIDGVILPELAVTQQQHIAISKRILGEDAFLIAGVAQSSARQGVPGRNFLAFDVPIGTERRVSLIQHKHHRWKLDGNQIRQYGLGTELDPRTAWWEHIALEPRTLAFVSMRPWLTMSALICEDLARQDPVAELVRAVGPNLVIALLMDAPQLASRWPARYATVLADDPGSSVLTITSLGMAGLSRPFNVQPRPRVIALWKDARRGDSVEIELPKGSDAVVLNLTVEQIEEFTADGRTDDGATGYPILSGIHFV